MTGRNDETVTPEVGMGATYSIGSDSYAYTVVEVRTAKTIVVQADRAKATADSEYYGNQSYTYERNEDAEREVFTLRRNGGWYRKGSPAKYGRLTLGVRSKYSDPSF